MDTSTDTNKRVGEGAGEQNAKRQKHDTDQQSKGVLKKSEEFKEYDQVNKPHSYHLSEQKDNSEQFDEEENIKIVDFSLYESDREKFAAELGSAMEDIGFVILENHGLDVELLTKKADLMAKQLFENYSKEEKMKFLATKRYGSVKCGYMPLKETSNIHPDLVEGWVFTRNAFNLPQPALKEEKTDNDENTLKTGGGSDYDATKFWPDAKLEEFFRKIVLEESKLILPIVQSILSHLKSPDIHVLDKMLENNSMALRLNYYPAVGKVEQTGGGRMLGHEDVTLVTLIPAPKREGLQVFNRKNGKWIRVKAPKGSIIMNTGDYLQRITNDVLLSTTHRVSKPTDPEALKDCRISVVLGVYLHHTDTLEVLSHLKNPRYPPVNVLQFHTKETSKFYGDKWAAGKKKESAQK